MMSTPKPLHDTSADRSTKGNTLEPPRQLIFYEARILLLVDRYSTVRDLHDAGVAKAQTGWLDDRFQEVLAVKAATTNRELTDFSIINFASH